MIKLFNKFHSVSCCFFLHHFSQTKNFAKIRGFTDLSNSNLEVMFDGKLVLANTHLILIMRMPFVVYQLILVIS